MTVEKEGDRFSVTPDVEARAKAIHRVYDNLTEQLEDLRLLKTHFPELEQARQAVAKLEKAQDMKREEIFTRAIETIRTFGNISSPTQDMLDSNLEDYYFERLTAYCEERVGKL